MERPSQSSAGSPHPTKWDLLAFAGTSPPTSPCLLGLSNSLGDSPSPQMPLESAPPPARRLLSFGLRTPSLFLHCLVL